MTDRPYAKAHAHWLAEHESIFRGILSAASTHKADLERLLTIRGQAPVDILAFVDLDERDIATAMKVCDRLTEGLSPTANAMRKELEMREQQPGSPKLPVL